MSRSSNNVAAGLYFGRSAVSCVLLQSDASDVSVASSKSKNLELPLFKGAPLAKTTAALTEALIECGAELRGRHVPVHAVVPDAALSMGVFELDQVPANREALARLVEFRLAKEFGATAGVCISQVLGACEGKTLLLGASMDKAWLEALQNACAAAGIVPWSLTAASAAVFNGFHDSVQGAGGAMISFTSDCWSLWAWDATGLARPLRSQWRIGAQDEREIASEVERALIAYTDGHAMRSIDQLHLWGPGAGDSLNEVLDRRMQKPCVRWLWPGPLAGADSCRTSASLASCVMAASAA